MKIFIERKRILCIFIYCLLASSYLYPQYQLAPVGPILDEPQGFILESLSGYGYSNTVINTISNSSGLNPALIFAHKTFSIGISNQFETRIDLMQDTQYYRISALIPQSICCVMPFRSIRLGLGFHQKYNFGKDFGLFNATRVDPDSDSGYAELGTVRLYKEILVYNYTSFIAVPVPKTRDLILGIRINYYQFKWHHIQDPSLILSESGYPAEQITESEKTDHDVTLSLGLLYDIKNVRLGMYYEQGADFDDVHGSIPDKLAFGFLVLDIGFLDFHANLNYVFWDKITYIIDPINSQIEYSGHILFHILKSLSSSLGVIHTNYRMQNDELYNIFNTYYNTYYLTFGLIYTYKNINFDISIADSHLFSDDMRKNTVFKLGFDVNIM